MKHGEIIDDLEQPTQEIKPFTDALKYGVLSAAAIFVTFFILYSFLSFESLTQTSWLTYIVLLVAVILSALKYRNIKYEGYINYGQSFTFILFVSIWTGLIIAVLYYLFYKFYDPSLIAQMLELAEENIIERMPNISDDELDNIIAIQSKFVSAGTIAIGSLLYIVIVGIIYGLIGSIFIKKEKPIEEEI